MVREIGRSHQRTSSARAFDEVAPMQFRPTAGGVADALQVPERRCWAVAPLHASARCDAAEVLPLLYGVED